MLVFAAVTRVRVLVYGYRPYRTYKQGTCVFVFVSVPRGDVCVCVYMRVCVWRYVRVSQSLSWAAELCQGCWLDCALIVPVYMCLNGSL